MKRLHDPFDEPTFSNPWSLRVFAVTLAAAEGRLFTLQEFQQALITQIRAYETEGRCIDSDETYYTRWVEALTTLLADKHVVTSAVLTPAELAVREALRALQHWHNDDVHDDVHDDEHHQRLHAEPLRVEAAR